MKLSIAMATYNGGDYLIEQLYSLVRQTRQPDELIVCDDGSSDNTLEILEDFKARVSFPVRLFRNSQNLGHEKNFSKAVDLCSGDLIFLCDQDDVWFPLKLEKVEKIFQTEKGVLLVINDSEITDGNLQSTGRTVLEQSKAAGVIGKKCKSLTLGCATAFRADLRLLISPIPALEYGHDSWIHDFTHYIDGRYILKETLQFYRRHGTNASNWVFDESAKATMNMVIQPSLGKDLSPAYDKRMKALDLMVMRLNNIGRSNYASLGSSVHFDFVIAELKHAIDAFERRKSMFKFGWFRRKYLATYMLFKGDYKHFLGWRSFGKDILR